MSAPKHHFFVPTGALGPERVRLEGDEAHHAARVLRIAVGETISVADGSGRIVDGVVTTSGPDAVEVRVILERTVTAAAPALALYQGLARRERVDLVVQKAVEVGAQTIVVFGSERSVVRWDEPKRLKAEDRWRAIALASAKQCRSPWRTTVHVAPHLGSVLDRLQPPVIVLAPEAVSSFRDVLPEQAPPTLGVVVGPEGGLTPAEMDRLRCVGATAASLGDRILRTETAGPVALALAAYSYGSLG